MRRREDRTWKFNPLRAALSVLAWASLALLPLLTTGCHKGDEESGEKATVVEVGTVSPVRMDMTRVVSQPGYLKPDEVTPIYTKISGYANKPRCDIGDIMKKGDLLVSLRVPEDDRTLLVKDALVKQAEADLKQAKQASLAAKAGMEAALADIDAKNAAIKSADAQIVRWQAEEIRGRKLVSQGTFDLQTLDEIIKELRTSEAKREEAKANYDTAKATYQKTIAFYHKTEADIEVAKATILVTEAARDQWSAWLSYKNITAPYDGIITDRKVHTDHFLQPANSGSTSKAAVPLFVMMKNDVMRCTVEVPEMDALLVRRKDKAVVQFEAIPGTEFEGEVTRTTKALDERSRTLRVEINVQNPDLGLGIRLLRPNMYAHVKILPKVRNAWMLPENAVLSDILANGDRRYCFVVEGGKARKIFLEIGARCEEGLQVLRKQRPGTQAWEQFTGKEVVITTNNKSLQDGQEVHVKSAVAH